MSALHKTPPPAKSAAAIQIEQLLARVGEGSVDSWTNPNGHTACATARRSDGRQVRIYVEGGSSRDASERVVLDAVRSMVGGAT